LHGWGGALPSTHSISQPSHRNHMCMIPYQSGCCISIAFVSGSLSSPPHVSTRLCLFTTSVSGHVHTLSSIHSLTSLILSVFHQTLCHHPPSTLSYTQRLLILRLRPHNAS
jgi:hypothetical protein